MAIHHGGHNKIVIMTGLRSNQMSKEGIVNIHGKEYKTVALRVTEFRSKNPDWCIETELIESTENRVVMKSIIS